MVQWTGPLNEKGDHILVCIDHATRYMDAVAIPSTSSLHYLDFMPNRWIPRFGVLSIIITDQARRFVNKRTSQFHHRLGITHANSPSYWPQSNGLIKQMVGTRQQRHVEERVALSHTCYQGHETWSWQSQPLAAHAWLRSETAGRTQLASAEQDIDGSQRLHELAKGREDTREKLLQNQRKAMVWYDERRRMPSIQPGDIVLLELSGLSINKTRLSGNYR